MPPKFSNTIASAIFHCCESLIDPQGRRSVKALPILVVGLPMDDKDRVFANFKDDKPDAPDRRELLSIPRRAGAPGSRVVEVVHVRSGGAMKDGPRRIDTHVRAASWESGFPAKQVVAPLPFVEPGTADMTTPTAHVMPAWGPTVGAAEGAPPAPVPLPAVAVRRGPGPALQASSHPPAQARCRSFRRQR